MTIPVPRTGFGAWHRRVASSDIHRQPFDPKLALLVYFSNLQTRMAPFGHFSRNLEEDTCGVSLPTC